MHKPTTSPVDALQRPLPWRSRELSLHTIVASLLCTSSQSSANSSAATSNADSTAVLPPTSRAEPPAQLSISHRWRHLVGPVEWASHDHKKLKQEAFKEDKHGQKNYVGAFDILLTRAKSPTYRDLRSFYNWHLFSS